MSSLAHSITLSENVKNAVNYVSVSIKLKNQLKIVYNYQMSRCLIMIEGIFFKGRCDTIKIKRRPYNAVKGAIYHSESKDRMMVVCTNDDDNTTACVEMIKDYIWHGEELAVRFYTYNGKMWTYSRIMGLPIEYRPGTKGKHIIEFMDVKELG
jgi:hypothetical protein